MTPFSRFLFETLSRIGISMFSGTLVSCFILHTVELLHFVLLGSGMLLMGLGYLVQEE